MFLLGQVVKISIFTIMRNIIDITDEKDLMLCCDLLHDADVNDREIMFDASKQTLDIFLDRKAFEKNVPIIERNWWIIKQVKMPILKSHLHLEDIVFCDLRTMDKSLKKHTFNECVRGKKDKEYLFTFCEVLKISILFKNRPKGYLKDELLVRYKNDWQLSFFPLRFKFAR